MDPELRARLFATDWDAWNHEIRPMLATPILAVLGILVGAAISLSFHLSTVQQTLVQTTCSGFAIVIGLTILALIDME